MDWPPGAHASTFGGNPVCVAAALVTLRLLRERVHRKCAAHGGVYASAAWRIGRAGFAIVGDVRGKGLMIGIEIVRDRRPKSVPRICAKRLSMRAFRKGLLILGAGENTLRLSLRR